VKKVVIMLAVAALVVPAMAKDYSPTLDVFRPGLSNTVPRASAYATGFETAEGFVVGDINAQQGWSVFSGDVNQVVSAVNPATGSQHYRNQNEPAFATGTLVGAFSPDLGASPIAPQMLSVDVNIGATGGADYDVVPQAPSQGLLTARVKFSWLGDILVLDDLGGGLAFQDTGVDYMPGMYKNLTIDMDPGANTLDYYYDGALVYSSVAGVYAGTAIEQVVLLSDNWHAGETGDFDNLAWTPEPASLALMGLALALIRRR
jgi:hypothetical protein